MGIESELESDGGDVDRKVRTGMRAVSSAPSCREGESPSVAAIARELEPTLWTIEEAAQRERVDMLAARIRAKDYDGFVAPIVKIARRYKTCGACGDKLSLEAFNRNRAMPDGRQSKCRLCDNRLRPLRGDTRRSPVEIRTSGPQTMVTSSAVEVERERARRRAFEAGKPSGAYRGVVGPLIFGCVSE